MRRAVGSSPSCSAAESGFWQQPIPYPEASHQPVRGPKTAARDGRATDSSLADHVASLAVRVKNSEAFETDRPPDRPANPKNRPAVWPCGRPIDRPIDRLTGRDRPTDLQTDRSTDRPTGPWTDSPVEADPATCRPTDQPTGRPADRPGGERGRERRSWRVVPMPANMRAGDARTQPRGREPPGSTGTDMLAGRQQLPHVGVLRVVQ